jgi:hypothetical protein
MYQLLPRLLRVRVLVSSCSKCSGTTVVDHAAKEKPKNCSVEFGPVYLGSMSFCGAVLWVKSCERWNKSKLVDFHKMLKNLLEGKQKVPN